MAAAHSLLISCDVDEYNVAAGLPEAAPAGMQELD